MSHKLQVFPRTNDGSGNVARDSSPERNPENISIHAGFAHAENPDNDSISDQLCSAPAPTSSNPNPTTHASTPCSTATAPVAPAEVQRCEVARSDGADPTRERAVACGGLAQVVCEYCGPMCAECAEDTFCFSGEHKIAPLPKIDAPGTRTRLRAPIRQVVYVEIKCRSCGPVRLGLPMKHTPKAVRKCPVCKSKASAQYLAHGFTRRRLPFHEIFTMEKPVPEGLQFKRRVPWDRRPPWFQE